MRIIAGRSKGRILKSVKGRNTRPTSDKVKESVFNIIQDRLQESVVLDLFAGTGNLGLEALSRGAEKVVFVDKNGEAIKTVKENCIALGYKGQSEIIRNDVLRYLPELKRLGMVFDIIFMDPPYHIGLGEKVLSSIEDLNILDGTGIVVAEHDAKVILPHRQAGLLRYDQRRYGGTMVSFYRKDGTR
ncbi:MAG: 16S rRNA (guanine(966)-N(2))-methyltransferase RsmD [Clostridiales bacterium]|nr:16S rRNA (guanine(966)-N(2))-methyltransferase RsmD [Clostridiales bacterium]